MKGAGLTPRDFTFQLCLYQEYFWSRLNTPFSEDFKVRVCVGILRATCVWGDWGLLTWCVPPC